MSGASVKAGRREVAISHPERPVFPAEGITKLDLARHYAAVAEVMLPHVRDRPLALQTFPAGVEREGFFLKAAPRHFPDWIPRAKVPKREGGSLEQPVARDPATFVYLAGQNAITPHIWSSRVDRLERPDRLIFDLDPGEETAFADVRATARALGDLLRELGLEPFAMTTGSRGLHVVTALRRTAEYGPVRELAGAVARAMVEDDPKHLTLEFRRSERGGRLYFDTGRTAYGQHAVAPYALRARPGAAVATPLHWSELSDRGLASDGWTIATVPDRLAELGGDPWAGLAHSAKAPGPALKAMARLSSR